jgi:hypothetical protein
LRHALLVLLCACNGIDITDDSLGSDVSELAVSCTQSVISSQGIKTCSYPVRGAIGRPAGLIDSGLGSKFGELTTYNPNELGDYWFLFWESRDQDAIYNGAKSASANLALSCYTANLKVQMFYHSNPGGSTYFVKIPKATFQTSCPTNFSSSDDTNLTFLGQRLTFGMPTTLVGRFNLAGVHFFSGRSALVDITLPFGLRGWNVEYVANSANRDAAAVSNARIAAQTGMKNIIRIDYSPGHATPNGCAPVNGNVPLHCWQWSFAVMDRIRDFTTNERLATIFVIGNEPNIEGVPLAQDYSDAFNHFYQARAAEIQQIEIQLGINILVLAPGPSGFSPTQWFSDMTRALQGVDGFALHTYGRMGTCPDPQAWCGSNQNQDISFRYYRSFINVMDPRWYGKPVYITEFNTDDNGATAPNPTNNYVTDWINRASMEVRNYNATRGGKPEVRSLCWFVDSPRGAWNDFALSNTGSTNLVNANTDMSEEFRVRANIYN